MGTKIKSEHTEDIKSSLSKWLFSRLKSYAKENGMSMRAAIRFIINQFFKDKPEY